MKARPIIFSAPMVRAILEGRKTQTRRVVANVDEDGTFWKTPARSSGLRHTDGLVPFGVIDWCPYGVPGDRLWVRETWRTLSGDSVEDARRHTEDLMGYHDVAYRATDIDSRVEDGMSRRDAEEADKWELWRPSIHMPRWASRIDLEVTGVRVERLQDISEADAQAEGCALECMTPTGDDSGSAIYGPGGFKALWESINGAGSWDANPWVWAVEFQRV